MSPKDLMVAMAVRRRMKMAKGGFPVKKDKEYSEGGEIKRQHEPLMSPMHIVDGIMRKKMAKGGMAESKEIYPEDENDFLSPDAEDDEDQAGDLDMSYPDPDGTESDDAVDVKGRRKRMIHAIFSSSS